MMIGEMGLVDSWWKGWFLIYMISDFLIRFFKKMLILAGIS